MSMGKYAAFYGSIGFVLMQVSASTRNMISQSSTRNHIVAGSYSTILLMNLARHSSTATVRNERGARQTSKTSITTGA